MKKNIANRVDSLVFSLLVCLLKCSHSNFSYISSSSWLSFFPYLSMTIKTLWPEGNCRTSFNNALVERINKYLPQRKKSKLINLDYSICSSAASSAINLSMYTENSAKRSLCLKMFLGESQYLFNSYPPSIFVINNFELPFYILNILLWKF